MYAESGAQIVQPEGSLPENIRIDTMKYVGYDFEGELFFAFQTVEDCTVIFSYALTSQTWTELQFGLESENVLHVSQLNNYRSVTVCREAQCTTFLWHKGDVIANIRSGGPTVSLFIRQPMHASRSERGLTKTFFAMSLVLKPVEGIWSPLDIGREGTSIRVRVITKVAGKKAVSDTFETMLGTYTCSHYAPQHNMLYVLTSDSLLHVWHVLPSGYTRVHQINFVPLVSIRDKSTHALLTNIFAAVKHHDRTKFSRLIIPIIVDMARVVVYVETEESVSMLVVIVHCIPIISFLNGVLQIHEPDYGTHIIDVDHGNIEVSFFPTDVGVVARGEAIQSPRMGRLSDPSTFHSVTIPMFFANRGHIHYQVNKNMLFLTRIPPSEDILRVFSGDVRLPLRMRVGALHLAFSHHSEPDTLSLYQLIRYVMTLPENALDMMIVCEMLLCCYDMRYVEKEILAVLAPDSPLMNAVSHIVETLPSTTLKPLAHPTSTKRNKRNVTPGSTTSASTLSLSEECVTANLTAAGVTSKELCIQTHALLGAYTTTVQQYCALVIYRSSTTLARFQKTQRLVCCFEIIGIPVCDGTLKDALLKGARDVLPRNVFTQLVSTNCLQLRDEILRDLPRRSENDDDLLLELIQCRPMQYAEHAQGMSPIVTKSPLPSPRCSLRRHLAERSPEPSGTPEDSTLPQTAGTPHRPSLGGEADPVSSLSRLSLRAELMNASTEIHPITGYLPLDALLTELVADTPLSVVNVCSHVFPLVPTPNIKR